MEPQLEENVESLSYDDHKLRVKDFVWCEDEWPSIKYDDFVDGEDIPIISLRRSTKKDEMYDSMCQDMVAAAHKWGFFKLVDHGVSQEIIEDIIDGVNDFFDLPIKQKVKGARTGNLPLGYSASNLDYGQNLPWVEILQLLRSSQHVVEFSQKVYDDKKRQGLSNVLIKYMKAVEELGMTILEMLAHGLGLVDNFFTRSMTEDTNMMIRINRYPSCPLPEKCLGLGSHSDPHTLTILLQDQVGGLQVRRDDDNRWIGVRPLTNSFVINIGDTLEAWSNGRLRSVVHRAVLNKERNRLSMAYFMSPTNATKIESPPELLDPEPNPRKYICFTWGEFKKAILMQKRVVGKTSLDRYLIYR
ncbi:naringenin,2-oxoglutarate 3-dioxygenase-like [Primulina tabacum]|uniref:naringenin,2-oxoglutarate 3-dioxygenase-like n=1 Tax=Primulina tabacum TaxID=48773 RepID=UPI003F5A10C2